MQRIWIGIQEAGRSHAPVSLRLQKRHPLGKNVYTDICAYINSIWRIYKIYMAHI